ncbi:MAG: hypothetical protein QOE08_818 [Thermoleophilaceae bacterium]|jgi:hypothetical protein|nr:hypothetical protein [Thermoleophilaceae bacterium]
MAKSQVRFVNASPVLHSARIQVFVSGAARAATAPAAYAEVTPYAGAPSGVVQIRLAGTPNRAELGASLVDGQRYTVVAFPKGKATELKMFQDSVPTGGAATLRVIHAAPELGAPDVRLGQRTIAQKVPFKSATRYVSVTPGSYQLSVTRPGDGGSPIASKGVTLSAGTASTAIITGSQGRPTGITFTSDGSVTPAGAPETGLGGLAGGTHPWQLILLSALLAGVLGGCAQRVATRRRLDG